jgi:hypothetical protein
MQSTTCSEFKMALQTDMTLYLNIGFQDGPNERKLDDIELESNLSRLKCHVCNLLPQDRDLGTSISRITIKSLNIGKWTSCERGPWASLTQHPPTTYNLQLTTTIHHDSPLSYTPVANIIESIYENGAAHSMTIEDDDYFFLYPYDATVSDLDDGICLGHKSAQSSGKIV